jgi:hypothetical protein
MRFFVIISISLLVALAATGCEFKKNISRDEIPIIKETIYAFEQVIKARNTVYLDSIFSSEARQLGMSPEFVLDFVYSDGLEEFAGFTNKQILFRGDAARVDGMIAGPDGPTKAVTITLRKENDVWLVKKIEARIDEPLKQDGDST